MVEYIETEVNYNPHFRQELKRLELDIDELDEDVDSFATREALLDYITTQVQGRYDPNSFIKFTFFSDYDYSTHPFYSDVSIPFTRVRDLDLEHISELFLRFLRYRTEDIETHRNEGGEDMLWRMLSMVQVVIKPPSDADRGYSMFFDSIDEGIRRSKSIITVRNNDRLCLFYALAIADDHQTKERKRDYVAQLMNVFPDDRQRHLRLHGTFPEDIQHIALTRNIIIHGVSFFTPEEDSQNVVHTKGMTQFYVSESYYPESVHMNTKALFFLIDGEHAHAIKKHTTLLGGSKCRWFCHVCLNFQITRKGKRTLEDSSWHFHACKKLTNQMEQCKECEQCGKFHYHSYICSGEDVGAEEEEMKLLQEVSTTPTPFYIKTVQPDDKRIRNVIFFDFETFVNREDEFKHTPTHVCASFYEFDKMKSQSGRSLFERYEDDFFPFEESDQGLLKNCGNVFDHYLRMEGNDCLTRFAKFISHVGNMGQNFSLFAHNGARFDNLILFNELKTYCRAESIILQGTKLIQAKFPEIRCTLRDSFLILPFPLHTFAKTFDLPDSKEFYPYSLHTPENLWEKESIPFPTLDDFEIKRKKTKKQQKELREWHSSMDPNQPYRLNEVCREYCKRDVLVLHAGVHKFRTATLESDNIDPFLKITTPSLAYTIFRRDHLEENLIQDMSKPILFERECLTEESAKWIQYVLECEGDGGESLQVFCSKTIQWNNVERDFHIDAICEDLKIIFVYRTVRSIAMPPFYTPGNKYEDYDSIKNETVYYQFYSQLEALREQYSDYKVLFMSCRKWKEIQSKQNMKITLHMKSLLPPLQVCDGYFGGRVEPWMYYTNVNQTTLPSKISKIDVVSLYPSVMVENYYPAGLPVRFIGAEEVKQITLNNVFGFVQCQVYVPSSELYPILPHQHEGKLMFPTGIFTGVFTSIELNHAINVGNVEVIEVYDILHYPLKRNDLFTDFIKSCIKGKMESSGNPPHLTVEEYVKEAEVNSGLKLNPEKVKKNPVIRLQNKLKANSFYGKFGERAHAKTKSVFTHQELYSLMDHEAFEVTGMIDIGNCQKFCTYNDAEALSHAPNTNVSIAAFVTAYARLILWGAIHQVETKGAIPIYGDTDSIVFLHQAKSMEEIIRSGVQLGEWEIECKDTIEEVVVLGPKAYSCKTVKGEVESHCKGVTLHVENSKLLSHTKMIDMCQGRVREQIVKDFRLVVNFSDLRGPHFPQTYNHRKSVKTSTDKRPKCTFTHFTEYQESELLNMEDEDEDEDEDEEEDSIVSTRNNTLFSAARIVMKDCFGKELCSHSFPEPLKRMVRARKGSIGCHLDSFHRMMVDMQRERQTEVFENIFEF